MYGDRLRLATWNYCYCCGKYQQKYWGLHQFFSRWPLRLEKQAPKKDGGHHFPERNRPEMLYMGKVYCQKAGLVAVQRLIWRRAWSLVKLIYTLAAKGKVPEGRDLPSLNGEYLNEETRRPLYALRTALHVRFPDQNRQDRREWRWGGQLPHRP